MKPDIFERGNEVVLTATAANLHGHISEQDRLIAAKQILLWLAILFVVTEIIYILKPEQGSVLLEICKTVIPPLATLIIAFYFRDSRK